MHKIWIVVAAIALWAVEAQAETRKTRNNRQAAEAWCAAKKAEGVDCKVAKTSGCGVGWTKAKRFREGGNAYYACERNRYGNASEQNKAECTAWCAENPSRCKACSRTAGCGYGYKQEKKFGGRGKNWYACDALWKDSRGICRRWCNDHEICSKCAPAVGCGRGFTALKGFDEWRETYFGGFGIMEAIVNTFDGSRWYACKVVGAKTPKDIHERDCKAWCESTRRCDKCSKLPGCGKGYRLVRSFKGKGRNWYACGKR